MPADRVLIIAQLARLANHFRSERPADSWEMLFDDYARDLDGISAGHLHDIVEAHRREKAWFPKVSELIERWNTVKYLEMEQCRRARMLISMRSAPTP